MITSLPEVRLVLILSYILAWYLFWRNNWVSWLRLEMTDIRRQDIWARSPSLICRFPHGQNKKESLGDQGPQREWVFKWPSDTELFSGPMTSTGHWRYKLPGNLCSRLRVSWELRVLLLLCFLIGSPLRTAEMHERTRKNQGSSGPRCQWRYRSGQVTCCRTLRSVSEETYVAQTHG